MIIINNKDVEKIGFPLWASFLLVIPFLLSILISSIDGSIGFLPLLAIMVTSTLLSSVLIFGLLAIMLTKRDKKMNCEDIEFRKNIYISEAVTNVFFAIGLSVAIFSPLEKKIGYWSIAVGIGSVIVLGLLYMGIKAIFKKNKNINA